LTLHEIQPGKTLDLQRNSAAEAFAKQFRYETRWEGVAPSALTKYESAFSVARRFRFARAADASEAVADVLFHVGRFPPGLE